MKTTIKNSIVLFAKIVFSLSASAQGLEVQLNGSMYSGGYNVSCYGASNGSINTIVVGGVAPFTYSWSNGATTKNLSNLAAGVYTVTVTSSNGVQNSASYPIKQPNQMRIILRPSEYGGFNISEAGGYDGKIQAEISGGVPPYNYIWNSGGFESSIERLTAGAYSLTVSDMTNCSVNASITLSEPSSLRILSITSPLHHGYNISCADGNDGAIELTVAGGVPPYTFNWNNGNFTEDLSDLKKGDYVVVVKDANQAQAEASITLTQPEHLSVDFQSPNSVSCYGCSNGTLSTSVSGGVSPYAYEWSSGQTTATIGSLAAGDYNLKVTDANGCFFSDSKYLTAPERNDWTMTGNAGTNPETQFIGTTDNKDIVFKSNNLERLRIAASGTVNVNSDLNIRNSLLFNNSSRISYRPSLNGQVGVMSFGREAPSNIDAATMCNVPHLNSMYQFEGRIQLWGNSAYGGDLNIMEVGFDGANAIIEATGTASADPNANRLLLNYYCGRDVLVGNDQFGDLIANRNAFVAGKLGIGTREPKEQFQLGDEFVLHNVGTKRLARNIYWNGTTDLKMKDGFGAALSFDASGDIFLCTSPNGAAEGPANISNRLIIRNNGKIGIGLDPPTNAPNPGSPYLLYVEGGIVTRDIKVMSGIFPDYVFNERYSLMSIPELESFIRSNKHLPGIPSENEVKKNDGFEVGKLQTAMLEKLEEQTLYIIDLQRQINELRIQLKK